MATKKMAPAANAAPAAASEVRAVPGRGTEGQVDGALWRIGSWAWMRELGVNLEPFEAEAGAQQSQSATLSVACESPTEGATPQLRALLAFADESPLAHALAREMDCELAFVETHRFPDGEIRLRLPPALPQFGHISRYWDREHHCYSAKLLPGEYYVTTTGEQIATVLGAIGSFGNS